MGFQSGLSGLNTASKNLDVIGNNVANASVVGFKGSQAQFADVFANSLSGAGAGQIGLGSKISTVAQLFTQGNISTSANSLDVAINGKGFFRMDNNGAVTYSRNGQFRFNAQGELVNAQNLVLTGYSADVNGNIIPSAPAPIKMSFSDIPPKSTSDFKIAMNLDANAPVPGGTFSATDATTFNNTTSGTVFDSLGNEHTVTFYMEKTSPLHWSVHATVDGGAPASVSLNGVNPLPLVFDDSGQLTSPSPWPVTASVTIASGAVTPLVFDFSMSGTTQFGAKFGVNDIAQDGFTAGRLAGFNIGQDGVIKGRYTNGQSRDLAQIVLADFRNPQGLNPIGDNQWDESSDSGLPIVGAPQTGSLGTLQSSAVEDSNVDLTQELVNMITAQRVYQANAQTIKTQDAVLQTLVNLR